MATGQRAQCEHGGGGGVAGGGPVRAAGGAVFDQLAVAQPAQGCAHRVGGGDDQRLHPRLGHGPGRDCGAARGPQRAQRVDLPAAGLRDAGGPTGLGGPGGGLGIDRVGLALPAAGLAVRAVDLDQLHPDPLQIPSQPGAVDPGPLDPDPHQLPEPAQPAQQSGVTGRGGRELAVPQQPARRIECCDRVGVFVRVDPTCHFVVSLVGLLRRGQLCRGGICHRGHVVLSFDREARGGTHQPGERTRQ